ncbi:hypothetical protein ACFL3T_04780, partial [Patescibacteria group bacterium]
MEDQNTTDIAELRTSDHALDLVYWLHTHIDNCCSIDGISEMHRIERELGKTLIGNAVRFEFKSKRKA